MRQYRYIWLPALLLLYGMIFAFWFGPDFLATGRTWDLLFAIVADILICVLLFFALKKKKNMMK